jgi:hypothetical protein
MYADDIVLITDCDVRALQRKTDRVTAELELWFNRNDLIINVGKRGIMSFHNRQEKSSIKTQVSFNRSTLEYTAELKFLGIYITETLKWNSHIQVSANNLRYHLL